MVKLSTANTVTLVDPKFEQQVDPDLLEQLSEQATLANANIEGVSDNESLQESLLYFSTQLKLNGEEKVRLELAKKRKNQAIDATVQNIEAFVVEGDRDSAALMLEFGSSLTGEQFRAALEDSAATEIVDTSINNTEMQQTIEDQGFEPTDLVRDNISKGLMLRNAADKIEAQRETRGIFGNTIDFLVRLIPYYDTVVANRISGSTVDAFTKFGTIKETLAAVEAMTPLEFGRYLEIITKNSEGVNLSNQADFINVIQRGELTSATGAGAIEVLDATIVLAPLIKIAKAAKAGTKLINHAGGRELATDAIVEGHAVEVKGLSSVDQAVETIEGTLPSGLVATESLATGVSESVSKKLQANESSIENVLSTIVTERLTPEGLAKAELKASKELQESFKYDVPSMEDFNIEIDLSNQLRTVVSKFGNKGRGYSTKSNANRAALETYKFKKGVFEIVSDDSGLHFIELRRHVTETGKGISAQAYSPSDFMKIGLWKRYVLSADATLESVTRSAGHLSATAQAGIQAEYGRLLKNLKGLNKGQRNNLELALKRSEADQAWMSSGELRSFYQRQGVKLTDKETLSYYTLKQLNDLDWHIRNSEVVKELAIRGHRKIYINAPKYDTNKIPMNGIIREDIDDVALRTIYDAETGRIYRKGDMTRTELDRFKSLEYKIIEPSSVDPRAFRNERVQYILVKDSHFSDTILDPIQLPYVAGGHRNYAGNWFIKQARRIVSTDGERITYLRPFTHNTGESLKELEKHADKLEQVRQVYVKEGTSIAEKDRDIRAIIPDLDYAAIKSLEDSGRFATDTPFVVVRDREIPDMLPEDTGARGARAYEHDDMPGAIDWYQSDGRMYYGHKGNTLPDIQGNAAPLVDPYTTASKAMNNSLRLLAFRNYQFKSVERWVQTASEKGLLLDEGARLETPYTRFKNSKIDLSKPDAEFMETQRQHINALLGQKTKSGERWEQKMLEWGEFLNRDMGLTKPGNFIIDHRSRDPITAMRGFVFDAKLGFFDVSQLLLQTQTSFAAASIDPINGFKAFRSAPLLRMALINGTDEVTTYLAKNGEKLTGTSFKEFEEMVSILKGNSGITNIGTELSIIDDLSTPQILNNAGLRGMQALRQKGRMFFFEGERINKITGFAMAYKRWRKVNPNKSVRRQDGSFDPNIIEELTEDTNTFSVNMTRASNAWWQRGVLSMPTQFASYQARLLELMLPKKLGGSRALTTAEKTRLAIGQVLFYGSATVPPVLGAKTLYENAVGEVAPDGLIEDTLQDGFWDTVFFPILSETVLGGPANTDFASRAGLFGNESLITEMWDPEVKFWDLAGGAVFTTGNDFLDAFSQMSRLAYLQNTKDVIPVTTDIINDIASITSTWSRADRGRFAYLTGFYMSKSGRLLAELNPQEAVLVAFGIPIKQVNDYYDAALDVGDLKRQDAVVAREMRRLQIDASSLFARGEDEKAARKMSLSRIILMTHTGEDPLKMDRILKSINVQMSPAWIRAQEERINFGLAKKAEREIKKFEETRE